MEICPTGEERSRPNRDGDGRPVCSEMWPGNTADVSTFIPVIDRLHRRTDMPAVGDHAHARDGEACRGGLSGLTGMFRFPAQAFSQAWNWSAMLRSVFRPTG
jgi:hypothetical protein